MELWLIRHALPVRVDGGPGPADPALAPEGLVQADQLASWWSPFGVDHVFVSPMRRARETAQPFAAAVDREVTVVEDLKEFDAHQRTYVPVEELRADAVAWEAVMADWLSPEAEASRQAFRAKVVLAIDAITATPGLDRVAVVCHGGVINAYLSEALNLPGTMFFEPAYTSVSRVRARDGHRQVVSLNEAPHLGRLVDPAISI